ncbi:MAG: hypothetical protein ABMA64_14495 [Myxococcota bacterium]
MFAFAPVFLTALPPLRGLDIRPTLSGPERTLTRGRFRVHWTEQGADAPILDDPDGTGRPDVIDVFADALVAGEAAYLAEGWRPLVGDAGGDGSDDIDVYVRDIGPYGTTTPVASDDGWSCRLDLDSNLSPNGQVAQSVATHELHHCVQFRYSVSLATWVFEAAATYEQYTHVVDPALDLALGWLYTERLGQVDRKLGAADGQFEYAAFLWTKFWVERGADTPERLPRLWEALGEEAEWQDGLGVAAREAFDRDLPRTFLEHATWNGFACAADDGGHYDPDVLPCIPTVTVPITPWDGAPVTLTHAEGPFTAAYLDLEPAGAERVEVACDGVDGVLFSVVPLDRDGVGQPPVVGEAGDAVAADVAGGAVRVVVVGTDLPLDATCEAREVPALRAQSLAGCATAPAAGFGWLGLVAALARRRR